MRTAAAKLVASHPSSASVSERATDLRGERRSVIVLRAPRSRNTPRTQPQARRILFGLNETLAKLTRPPARVGEKPYL